MTVLGVLATAGLALAEDAAPKIDSGDTAWMLVSTALVLLMTAPGLALFYGGLVRGKNVLSVLMQSFILMAVISVQWVLYGYSLAFGPDHAGIIGSLDWIGLRGVGVTPHHFYATTIPHQLFMAFQMTFAIITPALITGAFAERMKFSAFLVFSILWATFVYDPLAHMVWGQGGWLGAQLGALDFAGGTVVHISSGMSALVCALWMGKRIGFGAEPMPPHNLPFTLVGAALLWFGWFGFNAGSAGAASGLAVSAFVATNTAAATAALTWMTAEWIGNGKPTMLGAASGAVAGLVAITPGSGFVTPMASIAIGGVAGVVCWYACTLKMKIKAYDDALDVVGVHFVGGTWGALATGLFASSAINSAVTREGLFVSGSASLLGTQIIATLVTYGIGIVGSLVCLAIASAVCGGVRVEQDDEFSGLDLSQHSESAYVLGAGGYETATHGAGAGKAAETAVLRHAEAAQ
jgi:Amt family ammonium transporter